MRRNKYSMRKRRPAETLENVSQDTATAMHVTITKKFDKPSLIPLISRPMPAHTSSSQAADELFMSIGGTCAKPAA